MTGTVLPDGRLTGAGVLPEPTSLFGSNNPRKRLAQIWARYQRTGAASDWADDCYCADDAHCNALHDLVADDVPWLLKRLTELEKLRDDDYALDVTEDAELPWPGYCQACGAPLDPPNATSCQACGADDIDDD